MTSKNDPLRVLQPHGADQPRDDDIYATASETDTWCALKIRGPCNEAAANALAGLGLPFDWNADEGKT